MLSDRDNPILGLSGGQPSSSMNRSEAPNPTSMPSVSSDETSIIDNITLGQARVMTGDIGVQEWHRRAARKTTIKGNEFGSDVRIMTGDQGGDAAAKFNESFWT